MFPPKLGLDRKNGSKIIKFEDLLKLNEQARVVPVK